METNTNMKWSEIYLKTLREKPVGAASPGHILLLRGGYIYSTSQGIYLYNSLFLRLIQKLENMVRKEMNAHAATEILMPMVQSKKLWKVSGRWDKFEGLLLKMRGRAGQELCLGPTHEEVVIDFVRSHQLSAKDMPFNLYQIQTKYRDEIRPRFGLLRAREFIMKDAYSFDSSSEGAHKSYQKMFQAYTNIFQSLGLKFAVVEADSGSIGGSKSQEFHVLSEIGEDEILVSDKGSQAFNLEVCPRGAKSEEGEARQVGLDPKAEDDPEMRKSNRPFVPAHINSDPKAEDDSELGADQEIGDQHKDPETGADPKIGDHQENQEIGENQKTEASHKEIGEGRNPCNKKGRKLRQEFSTPGVTDISSLARFLKCSDRDLVKTLCFRSLSSSGGGTAPSVSSSASTSKSKGSDKQLQKDPFFIVLCSGEDEVNPFKLKRHFGLTENPVLAKESAVQEIFGTKPGSLGPWNLSRKTAIYLDQYLADRESFITGANKEDFHVRNIQPGRDFEVSGFGDFCYARDGDPGLIKGSVLKKHRGIEVGHLFYLSNLYSKKMDLSFLDKKGKKQWVEMGCYGLGITRLLQAVVEQSRDERGIIWPSALNPFFVHICLIDPDSPLVLKAWKEVLVSLKQLSLDHFTDDRRERPGVKFKDADLLGLPCRINIGERDLKKDGQIEVYVRKTAHIEKLSLKNLKSRLPVLFPSAGVKTED